MTLLFVLAGGGVGGWMDEQMVKWVDEIRRGLTSSMRSVATSFKSPLRASHSFRIWAFSASSSSSVRSVFRCWLGNKGKVGECRGGWVGIDVPLSGLFEMLVWEGKVGG